MVPSFHWHFSLIVLLLTSGDSLLAQVIQIRPAQPINVPLRFFNEFQAPGVSGTPLRADPLGDFLPPGALYRIGTTRLRHGTAINAVALSSDSKILASAGEDSLISIWDAATGKRIRRLYGHQKAINGLTFLKDGKTLASASADNTIRYWEAASGRSLRVLQGHKDGVLCLALSKNGKTLASGGADHSVRLWDAGLGRLLRTLSGHQEGVRCIAWDPASNTLASAGADSTIRLWNADNGNPLSTITAPRGGTAALAFSEDGKILAASGASDRPGNGQIVLWNPSSAKEIARLPGHAGGILALGFLPHGNTLVSAGQDNLIRQWDTTDQKLIRNLQGHRSGITSLSFSGDGKIIASASRDSTLRLWSAETGKDLCPLPGYRHEVTGLAFESSGAGLLGASRDGTLRLWDPVKATELRRFTGHTGGIFAFALASDGETMASAGKDGTVRLWNVAEGKQIRLFRVGKGHTRVWSVAWTPDRKLLAAASGDGLDLTKAGEVTVWEVSSGNVLRKFSDPGGATMSVSFSADGKAMAWGGYGKLIHWWNRSEPESRQLLQGSQVQRVAFAPQGHLLASGGTDGAARLWDLDARKELLRLEGHALSAFTVAFSPDGRTLAVGSQNSVDLWEVQTGGKRTEFLGHTGKVGALAFAPYDPVLVSGSTDTTVIGWDLAADTPDGKQIKERTAAELDSLWNDLGSPDSSKAYRAIWMLVKSPRQSVLFLRGRLQPAHSSDSTKITDLITQLDNDEYAVRQKASAELETLGTLAEPALRQTIERTSSAEVFQRVKALLDKLGPVGSTDRLRWHRALETLEHVGNREASAVLSFLATGAPLAPMTVEAKASLGRVQQRLETTAK